MGITALVKDQLIFCYNPCNHLHAIHSSISQRKGSEGCELKEYKSTADQLFIITFILSFFISFFNIFFCLNSFTKYNFRFESKESAFSLSKIKKNMCGWHQSQFPKDLVKKILRKVIIPG